VSDIVTRLRAVFHNDRSVEFMNLEAANEIECLRAERDRQTEIIITLRQELKEAKARNTLYLSRIQESEAREY
jgi:hypothetical protein